MADAPGKSDTPDKEKKPSLWQRFKEYAKNNPIRTTIMAILITAVVVVTGILTAGIATGALTIAGGVSLAAGAAGFAWDSVGRLNKGAKKQAAIEDKPTVTEDKQAALSESVVKRPGSSSTSKMIGPTIGMTSETRISKGAGTAEPIVEAKSANESTQQISHEKDRVAEMVKGFASKYGSDGDSGLFLERQKFAENYLKLDVPGKDKAAPGDDLQKEMLKAMDNYEKAYKGQDAGKIAKAGAKLDGLYEKVEKKIDVAYRSSIEP